MTYAELRKLQAAATFTLPVAVEDGPDPMIRDDRGWWVAQVSSKSEADKPEDDGRANALYIAALLNAAGRLLGEL